MRPTSSLLLLATALSHVSAAEAPRPRGVGPDFARFYKAKDSFACISNPSIKLVASQINDDYCDCPDGSDEPGTAACSHVSPLSPRLASDGSAAGANTTAALPGFYCKNKGHLPAYVPFQYVNDGVCDHDRCCDGSDEWDRVGGVSCPDRCKEIGKEWRKQDEARQKAAAAALKKKTELVAEAAKLKSEVEGKVEELQTKIVGEEAQVKLLESQLAETERKARGKVIKAPAKAGKVGVLAGLAKDRIEELRGSVVRLREQRDATRGRLEELEELLKTFKEEYNPNFNDEGVKRAVRGWDDYAAKAKSGDIDDGAEMDLDEVSKEDTDTEGMKWAEWQAPEEESEVDLLYKFEAYLPPSLRSWVDTKLRELRLFLIDNGVLAGTSPDGEGGTDPAVASARAASETAEESLKSLRNELDKQRDDLGNDYGPDGAFRALRGKCISKDSGEYTYEFCWFDRTKQRSKKGGGETNMGNHVGFETITVDDELPPDGKGLGSGQRIAVKHEDGQHCWNGPNRSTMVVLACAENDEIWKITEEEKCVYRMEVGTPAACEGGRAKAAGEKDEL